MVSSITRSKFLYIFLIVVIFASSDVVGGFAYKQQFIHNREINSNGLRLYELPKVNSDSTEIYLPSVSRYSINNSKPIIHVPQFGDNIRLIETAVFWFGKVTLDDTYTDVRIGYNSTGLQISLSVFDRLLWSDTSPSLDDLLAWDGASILISVDGNVGAAPGENAFRFDGQFYNQSPNTSDDRYMASYKGNGSSWELHQIPFTTRIVWRSFNNLNNNEDDYGWMVQFDIPFQSLGLSGPPPGGTIWGLSVRQYNRNSISGETRTSFWPDGADAQSPYSWSRMSFGLLDTPEVSQPATGSTVIRNGFGGVTVPDGMVGGNTTCGEGLNFWTQWGNVNYIGATQVNVQNQWDVSDQPCFSKYYITFPLDTVPQTAEIISATLTLNQFGNSYPPGATASLIQVYTVRDPWSENTISWNNAPGAFENLSRLRVPPLTDYPGDFGVPRNFDVGYAVIQARSKLSDLNLVVYSADAAIHSGKYFWSSDADYPYNGIPTLTIYWTDN